MADGAMAHKSVVTGPTEVWQSGWQQEAPHGNVWEHMKETVGFAALVIVW